MDVEAFFAGIGVVVVIFLVILGIFSLIAMLTYAYDRNKKETP
jgi:TRAP-type mannitol/chloroaromatic compound transport system permease large subunit